jgi:hypothetical protein
VLGRGGLRLSNVIWNGRYDRCGILSSGYALHSHFLGQLDSATNKARMQLKQLAAKGDTKSARILAKEVVRSNKQKNRLHVSKARLGSIEVQLMQQMGALDGNYDAILRADS